MAKITPGPLVSETRGKVGDTVFTRTRGGSVVRALTLTTPPDPGGGVLLYAKAVLTDAQVKALPTSPVIVVPAPGTGKLLIPLFGILHNRFTAGAYTGVPTPAEYPYIFLGTGIDTLLYTSMVQSDPDSNPPDNEATYFFNAVEWLWSLTQYSKTSPDPSYGTLPPNFRPTNTINQPIYMQVGDFSADLTGGNPANTLTVHLYYVLLDTA